MNSWIPSYKLTHGEWPKRSPYKIQNARLTQYKTYLVSWRPPRASEQRGIVRFFTRPLPWRWYWKRFLANQGPSTCPEMKLCKFPTHCVPNLITNHTLVTAISWGIECKSILQNGYLGSSCTPKRGLLCGLWHGCLSPDNLKSQKN